MPRFKATALIDGKETDVELDDARYMSVDQHNVRVKETVRQRLNRQAISLRKDALEDEDFVTDVLKSKGIDPKTLKPATGTGDKGGLAEAEAAKLLDEWRKKELTPLQEQLTAAQARFEKSNATTLKAQLTTDLIDAGFDKGIAPRLAELEASRFGFDEKSGKHAVKKVDGEGFAFSTAATEDAPFKGTSEWAKEYAGDKNNTLFLAKTGQTGPGVGGTPGGGAGAIPAGSTRASMTPEAKVEFIGKHGFDAFTKLPEK